MALTYRDAGVDVDAGNDLVRRIAEAVRGTHRPEMQRGFGGFAAVSALPGGYREPLLVSGTDGVGTKLKLAFEHNRHDTVGQDLVAMCANDVLVCGAEPFLFLDYYATGALDVDVAERVIRGIAQGCELAGCSLAGGETAEMPGFYAGGEYDLAGFCVGVVEKEELVTGAAIEVGDALIGLASSGPHSNGYSLIRRILADRGASDAGLVDALLAPTRIYVRSVRSVTRRIRGMCHITGGGFVENVPRMFGERADLAADIDLDAWQRPEAFHFLQQAGNVAEEEMLRTFNLGIGFILCVAAEDATQVVAELEDAGETARRVGTVVAAGESVPPGHVLLGWGPSLMDRGPRERDA